MRSLSLLCSAAFFFAEASSQSFTPLTEGLTSSWYVASGSKLYFSVSIQPATYTHIDVTLSPSRGDVDMYITLDPNAVPSEQQWMYKSESHTGDDYDIIHTADVWYQRYCSNAAPCELRIMVQPAPWSFATNNSFVIGAASSAENLKLEDGVSLVDHALDGTWSYYRFELPTDPGADAEVLISLTPYAGDPDCYASTTVHFPSAQAYDPGKSSSRTSRDVIRYYDSDTAVWCPQGFPCNFYIGVVAFRSNASYGIVAHLRSNNSITLVDGQYTYQYVQEAEDLQFKYEIPADRNIMEVVVTPAYGDPDLYVTLDGLPAQPGHSQYHAAAVTGSEVVLARPGDGIYNDFCERGKACLGRIGVYAFRPTLFSIVAFSGNAILLPENMPISGAVGKDESDYFVYEYSGGPSAIVIAVTPLSGDVDLYVDDDKGGTQMPGPGHYSWASRGSRLRREVVEIYPSDRGACHVGEPCRYYIGIVGFDNSSATYNLVVKTHGSTPTTLQPGQPQVNLLNASKRAFYTVPFASGQQDESISITVSPTFGDPDIYASWGNRTLTTLQHDYGSQHTSGDDTITARRNEAVGCDNDQVCYLTVLVYGWTNTVFSIVAKEAGSSTQLIDGQSVGGNAATSQSSQYTFVVTSTANPATFAVTPLSGDPDLYVAGQPNPGPGTPGTRRSEGFDHETIVLSSTDIASICTPSGGTSPFFPCTLYVAVRAASGTPASWRIMASTSPPALSLSAPTTSAVDRGRLSFFTFHLPSSLATDAGSVQVAVTPSAGTAYVYVSAAQPRTEEPLSWPSVVCTNGALPPCQPGTARVTNYRYSSQTSLGAQTVAISDYVPGADYAVGVFGADVTGNPATVEFTITATAPDSDRVLSSGVPVDGNVDDGAYQFYKVFIDQPGVDVRVSLTQYSGDPDLYVSWHDSIPRPNTTSFDARSLTYNDEVVSVVAGDWASACTISAFNPQCAIYIGVYGYDQSSYSLVAVVNSSSPTLLLDGQPQTGSLQQGESALYSIPVRLASPTDTYSIAVVPTSGDPDLYVRKDERPGRTAGTYDHKSDGIFGTELINIGPSDPSFCPYSCTVFALVYGFSASEYQIVYSSNGVVVELRDGTPQVRTGLAKETAYFAINVPEEGASQLRVALTVLTGEAALYMDVESTPDTRPNPNSGATWSSTTFGDDSITVSNPIMYCERGSSFGQQSSCNYIIGVYSSIASRFTLVATLNHRTVTQLSPGSPQQGMAPSDGSFVYFYTSLPHLAPGSTVELDVTASTSSGGVDLFATDTWNPSSRPGQPGYDLPNATYWRYTTTDPGNRGGRSTIAVVWTEQPTPGPFLAIGVRTRQQGNAAPFTLSVSSSETITTLQLSRPSAQRSIVHGETQHYLVQINDLSADIVVNLNAFRGVVYAVLSTRMVQPYCFTQGAGSTMDTKCVGTWQANSATSTSIRVAASDPCASAFNNTCTRGTDWKTGPWYIGVYASVDAQYTITAQQLTPVMLSDGSPERGTADQRPTYFALRLGSPDAAQHDVKFTLTRTDETGRQTDSGPLLALYMKSCTAAACTDDDKQPSAANNDISFLITSGSSTATAIAAANTQAHCQPTNSPCVYFINVVTVCNHGVLSCPTDFQLLAASQSATSVTMIDYSSIQGDVTDRPGSVPPGDSAEFEVFLQPSQQKPTTAVRLAVEACGPGLPDLYVCDSTCSDPFNPSAGDNKYHGSTQQNNGLAVVSLSTTAEALYVAVAGSREDSSSASFVFAVAADDPYILTPQGGAKAEVDAASLGIQVTWSPVTLVSPTANVAAQQVEYTVLLRPGGFTGTGAVATTACGLEKIASSAPGVITRLADPGATSIYIGGLDPDTEYGVNIIAKCGPACLQASLAAADVLEAKVDGQWVTTGLEQARQQVLTHADAHSRAMQQPQASHARRALLQASPGQSSSQSVAMGAVAKVTTGPKPPPLKPEEGFPEGAVIGLSVMGGLIVFGVAGFFCYRRWQAGNNEVQYRAFSARGAMDTLPMPASGYAEMFDD